MLIRSSRLPTLINALEKEGDLTPQAADTATRTITYSSLPTMVDPLLELRRSLEGVISPRIVQRAVKKAAQLMGSGKLGEIERAQALGQGLLAIVRGAKQATRVAATALPVGSPYAALSTSNVNLLRQTSLQHVVETAQSKGAFLVFPDPLTPAEKASYENEIGLPVVGAGEAGPANGVAIHLGAIPAGGGDLAKGELNPMLGDVGLQRWIEGNKWREALVAQGAMPETVNAADLLRDNPVFSAQRQLALSAIEAYNKRPTPANEERVRRTAQALYDRFMMLCEDLFPTGAFVKFIGEFATGDKGQLNHTGKKRPAGRGFAADVKAAREAVGAKSLSMSTMQAALASSKRSPTHILRSLLHNPAAVLVQERLAIAKTRDGETKEVRIDLANGVVVNASLRYGVDYAPDDLKRAAAFVQQLFDRLGPEWRTLSAGIDVAVLENGELAIIEFNVGNESGFMDPTLMPLEGNLFLSRLCGKPLPFLQRLEEAALAGIEAQCATVAEIAKEPIGKPVERALGAAVYFRDRMLELWRSDPTPERTAQTKADLRQLCDRYAAIDPAMAKTLADVSIAAVAHQKSGH